MKKTIKKSLEWRAVRIALVLVMCFAVTALSARQTKGAELIQEVDITVTPIKCGTEVTVDGEPAADEYADDEVTQTPALSVTVNTDGVTLLSDFEYGQYYNNGGKPFLSSVSRSNPYLFKKTGLFEGKIEEGAECWICIQLYAEDDYEFDYDDSEYIESVDGVGYYANNVKVTVNGSEAQFYFPSGQPFVMVKLDSSMIEHDWDDGVVTKEPTATETGVKTYTCQNCDATKTEEIAATGEAETKSDVPQTDDHSNTVVWIVLLAVALVGGSAVLITRKLKKEQ